MSEWYRVVAPRVLGAALVLFGSSLLTFFIFNVLPGSAARQLLGIEATPEQVARLEAQLGLDRPAWQRYGEWLEGVARGDLGRSFVDGRPVSALIAERLPVTAELVAYTFTIAVGLAVILVLFAARAPGGIVDRLSSACSAFALAAPSYLVALVAILVFAVKLRLFPSLGFAEIATDGWRANLRSLTLPAVALALPLCGMYTRFLRGDLLEQLQREDYVLAARARGLGPWRVLLNHAFRNSIPGFVALIGMNIGALLGGTLVVEQVFALPGLGQLLLQSTGLRDINVVEGSVFVLASTTVLASAVVDVVCALIDPRIRFDAR